LQRDQGIMFVVVDAHSHFQRPARYGDLLQVSCEIEKWTRTSLTFRQEVARSTEAADRELLVAGTVRVACLDAAKFRPRALPESLIKQMTKPGES
jgi:acyl-CoA thioester hydrolase